MAAQAHSSAIPWQETSALLEGRDESAQLESLVREHTRFVFKVAYGILRNAHDAEDVVQETFLRVHRAGPERTHYIRDFRGWLARVAFRLALDRVRKTQQVEITDPMLEAKAPSAEQLASDRQQIERARRLIATLPEELRCPLVLSAIEELSSTQIAQMLGVSDAAVRGRIFRARQLLKERLARRVSSKS